ncbi:MAG: hypothetical protein E6R03_16875 [Hyphomicrobiaceae bacterium]|nr:MAG: hypothetical protein E6R03_16875 [Hyphomicrobiaceae bacterium]
MLAEQMPTDDDTIAVYRSQDGDEWTISIDEEHDWTANPSYLQIHLDTATIMRLSNALRTCLGELPPPLPTPPTDMDGELPTIIGG